MNLELLDVQGACEILGFDPLYVANEGRFVAFIPKKDAEQALEIMRSHQIKNSNLSDINPCIIGYVTEKSSGIVKMTSKIGVQRIVDMLSGEQLPRIC